jgi:pimeloyl-ACP methyl ester carboxylesterase
MLRIKPVPQGPALVTRRKLLQISVAGLLASQVGRAETGFAAEVELRNSASRQEGSERKVQSVVRAFTNRAKLDSDVLEEMFSSGRGSPSYLRVEVQMTIDRTTSLPISYKFGRHNHFTEREMLDLSRHRAHDRKAMLFCHGYNYTFTDALRAAARLKSVAGPTSPMFVQSWPSWGGFFGWLGYVHDIGQIDFATRLLRRQIVNLLQSSDIDRLQIIGHSMGSRAIIAALDAIFQSADRDLLKRISHLVLAAPDLDQEVMDRDYLPIVDYAGIRTLVYVSNKDKAMWWSELVNGNPRVGSTDAQLYVREQIATVNVTDVDTSLWGHSAIFDSQRIASDLYYFLNREMPVEQRFGLRPMSFEGRPYWHLEP